MKLPYIKVTIEAPVYEAKAAAEQYSKDRKYKVLSRSKAYPCKESSNVASDSVLIPVVAEYLPVKGLQQLLKTVIKVKKHYNPDLEVEGRRMP